MILFFAFYYPLCMEDALMQPGSIVEVREAFGKKGLKRVVSQDDRNVYVSTEQEYGAAKAENREPVCVGFPRQFVLRVVNEG